MGVHMYLQSKDANCRILFYHLQDIISLKYLNIERGRLKTCVHRFYVVIHQLSLVVCNQRIGTGLNSLFSNHPYHPLNGSDFNSGLNHHSQNRAVITLVALILSLQYSEGSGDYSMRMPTTQQPYFDTNGNSRSNFVTIVYLHVWMTNIALK